MNDLQPPEWTCEEACRNVHVIRTDVMSGQSFDVLLISDAHWDHPSCDRKLLKRHLDQALARNAPIISNGDFFCAMQGPGDRRGSKGSSRPEHDNPAYFTSLTDTAADWLAPYARNLTVWGDGNHETAATRHNGVDLTRELVGKLRARGAVNMHHGGYHGFIRFGFSRGRFQASKVMYLHHGSGGGGYATRGALTVNKRQSFVKADVIWSGHIHQSMNVPVQMLAITQENRLVECEQLHLVTPGYKTSYISSHGFEVEKEHGPRPRGGAWLTFRLSRDVLHMDARRAA